MDNDNVGDSLGTFNNLIIILFFFRKYFLTKGNGINICYFIYTTSFYKII